MFLLTHFARFDDIFVHEVFRQDSLPLKTRQSTPVWLLLIDQLKTFGARLVFLIITDWNFGDDKGNAWVETWFKEKDCWRHDENLNIQLTVGIVPNTYTKRAF